MSDPTQTAARYLKALRSALSGTAVFFSTPQPRLEGHDLNAEAVTPLLTRLGNALAAFENRLAFSASFRVAQADSGFPAFQHILELQNDRARAAGRLGQLPDAQALRAEMANHILTRKTFPTELKADLAERLYLEGIKDGAFPSGLDLPDTIRLGVNADTMRPRVIVRWSAYDGVANLPMAYLATIEDSTDNVMRDLVRKDGTLNPKAGVKLPVAGLLNPDLARSFDAFAEKNASYSLSPVTIATNLDRDFATLHPKLVRRIVLGPFWTVGVTRNNATVSDILSRIRKPENAWLMTWTVQDIASKREIPEVKGFFSSEPAKQEFHIETADLEAAQMGVSAYEKHALVPHEAYQALWASGEARKVFDGYKVHIIAANGTVTSDA
ncbi:MAG: hypothetical protein MUC58_02095 [Rhizobiaceae bacterium]|jgi:hypothetical protein|nr:hypothetical protein [Rhizobiaceae bacterium]